MKVKKKLSEKQQVVITVLALTLAFVVLWLGICAIFFPNQLLTTMPCWVICKRLGMEIPMGSTAEEAVAVLQNNREWAERNRLEDAYNYHMSDGGLAIFPYQFEYESYYSFNHIDYQAGSENESLAYGSYTIRAKLGCTILNKPFYGRMVDAFFVFDENQRLIDIVVTKYFIGF